MNVKLGDLAIVVKGKNSGKICKIIRPGESENFIGGWVCEFPSKVKTDKGLHLIANVRDEWLRPVSGLPDTEHTDEREPIKELA